VKAAILKNPFVILASAAIGGVIGFYNIPISTFLDVENFAKIIAVPGQIYLFYLQMTVIPIIITAIASSIGKLIRNRHGGGGGTLCKKANTHIPYRYHYYRRYGHPAWKPGKTGRRT
jgi:hypothetical protein